MGRFIIKKIQDKNLYRGSSTCSVSNVNKDDKLNEAMTTMEKVELAQQVFGDKPQVKRVKKDRGLIERAESTKTILTEDNKELLND